MIQFDGEFDPHVLKRLKNEAIIWLTTISANGTPQPNPIWFYWGGESCLIYSQKDGSR